MNCGKCGGPIGNRIIRYNGVTLCENCARELGVDEAIRSQSTLFGQAFPMFEEMANTILGAEPGIEFANTKIRCPRCKMTLREFETSGQAGCIECFNTFNETIIKHILKRQGSSEYKGRKPGDVASITVENVANTSNEVTNEAVKEPNVSSEAVNEVKPETKAPVTSDNEVDISTMATAESLEAYTNEQLELGMKKAASEENYPLAMRLRDELKKRKEGN